MKRRRTQIARVLRNNATPAERALWRRLSGRQIDGFKFRRQQPIGDYVVDFYCPAARLVVELDGRGHERREQEDAWRESRLKALGLRVLRFFNRDVLENPDGVLTTIERACCGEHYPPPNPPPQGGRAAGP